MDINNFIQVASDSDGVLYVIVVMLFAALTVIIERTWFLHRAASSGTSVLDSLDRMETVSSAALTTIATRYKGLPVARVLSVAARLDDGRHSQEEIDSLLDETILREAPRVDRFLWVLDTVVTLAPLLGLFGTIVGMFHAFNVLSNPGQAPTQVTGGVAQALVATASGLFVAMIGLLFFNGLHQRVRLVVHELETLKTVLLNRMIVSNKKQQG